MTFRLVPYLEGELASSRIARSASLNCCDDGEQLLADLLLPKKFIANGCPHTHAIAADRFGQTDGRFEASYLKKTELPHVKVWRGTRIHRRNYDITAGLICHCCMANGTPPDAVMLQWSLTDVACCPLHGELLRSPDVIEATSTASCQGADYLLKRLGLPNTGTAPPAPFLDSMSWIGATAAMAGFGSRLLDPTQSFANTNEQIHLAMEVGFQALMTRDRFEQALERCLETVEFEEGDRC